ncbi:hypothetical protein FKM82_025978, partial [Ascaphus truei]
MGLWLCVVICVLLTGFSRADNVTQTPSEVTASVGGQVTLDCKYETKYSDPYLFWYVQHSTGMSPRFILRRYQYHKEEKEPGTNYAAQLNKENKSIYLRVSDLSVSDSGVYYCALSPT